MRAQLLGLGTQVLPLTPCWYIGQPPAASCLLAVCCLCVRAWSAGASAARVELLSCKGTAAAGVLERVAEVVCEEAQGSQSLKTELAGVWRR